MYALCTYLQNVSTKRGKSNMTEESFLIVSFIMASVSAICFLVVFIGLNSIRKDTRILFDRVNKSVSETLFEFERDRRRQLQDEIDAIKEHFGIETARVKASMRVVNKEKNT